ncbi:nuclear mRNA export, poly(A)+RNA binding protein, partial [Dissophora globulifera]
MLPGGGRSGRGGRSRGGGGGGGRSNADRDRNDSATVTGNEEIGFFTSRGQAAGGPVRQTGGPVRQTGRRGGRSSGGILRGAASLPPRPTRGTDQDGDLAMGAEKKNFSPYQRPKRNNNISSSSGAGDTRSGAGDSIDPTGTVVIFVTGRSDMPSLANDSGLYDFLNRKASPMKLNITSKRTNEMSGVMSFVVGDFAQAKVLRNLSGIRYKGQKLSIKTSVDDKIGSSTGDSGPSQRPSAPPSHGTIDAMRNFMRSRYNNGFLNLENMAQDSILRAAKIIPPGQTRGRSDVGTVMMKVAAELFPETTTISFAMNGIRSLQPISAVSIYFPNLQNLSFKGNNIQYFRDLEYLSGKKLPHLKELILLDNPVRDRDLAKNNDDLSYRSSVLRLFPSIVMLDQVPVTNKISFGLGDILKDDLPEHAVLPAQIKGNFFDNAGTEATALEFLASYLKLFDTNRRSLEHAYDMNATFSLQTMTPISPLQKRKNQAADNWAGYISHSRNLSKIKDL